MKRNTPLLLGIMAGILVVGIGYGIVKVGEKQKNGTTELYRSSSPIEMSGLKSLGERPKTDAAKGNSIGKSFHARLSELREAAAKDPHNAMRWIEIAKLYNSVGEYYRAYQYLKKSLEMDPDFKYKTGVEEVIDDYENSVLDRSSSDY